MPSDIAAPAANYAHARLTTGAGRWLHTSGVVAIAPDGGVPGGQAKKKKGKGLLIGGISALAVGSACAGIALAQNDVMDGAGPGEVQVVKDAWRNQQIFGYSAYGLWGLGAAGVGLHFAL